MFVHMGGAWGTEREIDIIKGSGNWYKKLIPSMKASLR